LLLGAIALEVVSTSLLNASQGMTRWGIAKVLQRGLA
jgi:multidrug transporter EmrE-like cation transporter